MAVSPGTGTPEVAVVAAAAAALGRELTSPVRLSGGSQWSVVLRCDDAARGSVVVKAYPVASPDGPSCFAAEAAGLQVSGGLGHAPELLAADPEALVLVMSDLGSAPSMADVLLGDSALAARDTVLAWADGCGELSAATAARMTSFETEKSRYLAGRPDRSHAAQLASFILQAGERVARLAGQPLTGLGSVRVPAGLEAEVRAVASAMSPAVYPVFSPGDLCPDNNLVRDDGIRFLDFESAGVYCTFLDAAYVRMPFSTCWCTFRLPPDVALAAEAAYRAQVVSVHPALADDAIWAAGMRNAIAAWSLSSFSRLLARAVEADEPMEPGRTSPGIRQLVRHRWQVLVAEAAPSGELPALTELARSMLAATAHWQVPDLPPYPAFR